MIYINKVNFSGYKSIENLNVNFVPGLNIIIGKNAVGKTNFLQFLFNSLNFDFRKNNNFKSEIGIISDKFNFNFSFEKKTKIKMMSDENSTLNFKKINPDFKGEMTVIDKENSTKSHFEISDEDQIDTFNRQLDFDNIFIKPTFIKHGLPTDYPIVERPLNIELLNKNLSDEFLNIYFNRNKYSNFLHLILGAFITPDLIDSNFFNKRLKKYESIEKFTSNKRKKYKNEILDNLKFISNLNLLLKEYSPIESIRINDNFLIEIDNEYEKVSLKNFYLEFFVDNKWFTFDDLSDGTRRIFYLISEIFTLEYNKNPYKDRLNIICIEEPELGIHPHQLYRLMSFIKEKSRNNQIILTTHSPLSLDILESNELSSIIIGEKIDGYTSFSNLSEDKVEKARLYMKELNLSDYWLNSDLEP